MPDLFRAEWLKIAGNRWAAGLLIWIFPIGAGIISLLAVGLVYVSDGFRLTIQADPGQWTDQVLTAIRLPSNILGRMLVITFAVVIFAGEYQWRTWKNIVSRRRRAELVLAKFATFAVFVLTAFILMAVIWGLGRGLVVSAAGGHYGPDLAIPVLTDFAREFGLELVLVFTAVLIAAGQAALIAMVFRSILGGILTALAFTLAEPLLFGALLLASLTLKRPYLVRLYRAVPYYHIENVSSWVRLGLPGDVFAGFSGLDPALRFTDSLGASIAALLGWAVGLVVLITWLFRRQDITG